MSTQLKLTLQRNKKVEGDRNPRENGNRSLILTRMQISAMYYGKANGKEHKKENLKKKVKKTRRPRSIYRKSNITSEYIPGWVYIWHLFHAIYVRRNPISEIPARQVRKFSQHQLSDIPANIFISVTIHRCTFKHPLTRYLKWSDANIDKLTMSYQLLFLNRAVSKFLYIFNICYSRSSIWSIQVLQCAVNLFQSLLIFPILIIIPI